MTDKAPSDQSPYERFATSMMQPDSKYIPQILKYLINEQQAEMMLALPGNAAQLAEKFGISENEATAEMAELYHKGLAFGKEKEGVMSWRAPLHLAQFHDATIVWAEATEEFFELWRQYMEEE